MKVGLTLVAMSVLVAGLVVVANEMFFDVTVDESTPVIIEYTIKGLPGQCYGSTVEFAPTTGEYETHYRHYFSEGEAQAGQYLCLKLSNHTGYSIEAVRIKPVYRASIPMIFRCH